MRACLERDDDARDDGPADLEVVHARIVFGAKEFLIHVARATFLEVRQHLK